MWGKRCNHCTSLFQVIHWQDLHAYVRWAFFACPPSKGDQPYALCNVLPWPKKRTITRKDHQGGEMTKSGAKMTATVYSSCVLIKQLETHLFPFCALRAVLKPRFFFFFGCQWSWCARHMKIRKVSERNPPRMDMLITSNQSRPEDARLAPIVLVFFFFFFFFF